MYFENKILLKPVAAEGAWRAWPVLHIYLMVMNRHNRTESALSSMYSSYYSELIGIFSESCILLSLNIFYCIFGKGVELQVLSTLVTARPLQHIYNSKHGIHTINKL